MASLEVFKEHVMRMCMYCGSSVPMDAKFCPNCSGFLKPDSEEVESEGIEFPKTFDPFKK